MVSASCIVVTFCLSVTIKYGVFGFFFFFQAEDGIRDLVRSRGLGDVYKRTDYAYIDKKMKNTLQAVSKHKYCDVLEGFGNSDITYNLSFNLINRIVKELSSLTSMNTTQGEFLTKLGILERAEILSKKMLFSEKADIYFRIKRLIDKNQMGELFKVMLITTHKNKFKLGF